VPRQQLLSLDLPVADAFALAFHSRSVASVILCAGLFGLFATWNALFFATSRALYALGRGCLIPSSFGDISGKTGTPLVAISFITAVTLVGLLFGRGVLLLVVNVTSTAIAVLYVLVTVATRRYRVSRPNVPRSYRVPGRHAVLWFAILVASCLLVLSLYQQYAGAKSFPLEWGVLLFVLIFGIALWHGLRKQRSSISDLERRRQMLL
jgi:APA family basic amino acid/polyamine antiporter